MTFLARKRTASFGLRITAFICSSTLTSLRGKYVPKEKRVRYFSNENLINSYQVLGKEIHLQLEFVCCHHQQNQEQRDREEMVLVQNGYQHLNEVT
jgi:hypothetical protein